MALSKDEITRLAARAESILFNTHVDNDLPLLKEAIDCLDRIIQNAPPTGHYYQRRALAKYRLAERSGGWSSIAASAIQDITKAIELVPDRAYYYQTRANMSLTLLAGHHSGTRRVEDLKMVLIDYQRALSKDPTVQAVWLNMIAVNVLLNDWDEAISVYGQSKPYITDKAEQPIRAWLGCLALVLAGDMVTAEDEQPLVEDTNKLAHWDFLKLVMVHVCKTPRSELSPINQAKVTTLNERLLSRVEDQITRALVYSDLCLHDQALSTLDEITKRNPRIPLAWNNKGFTLQNLARYEEALQAYAKAIELAPDYLLPLSNTTRILIHTLERYEDALSVLDKMLNLEPNNAATWVDRSYCLGRLSRYAEALEADDKALTLDPGNAVAWLNKGFDLEHLTRYNDALTAYSKATELAPDYMLPLRNKSQLLMNTLNRYEDALSVLDKMLSLEPNNAATWIDQSYCLGRLARYMEALDADNKALTLDPGNAKAWNNKGFHLEHLTRYNDALTAYSMATELAPDYMLPLRNKSQLLMNTLNRYVDALSVLDKMLSLEPNNAATWVDRSYCLGRLSRYAEALEADDKALTLDPGNAIAWNNKGYHLHTFTRYDEALSAYSKATELAPNYLPPLENATRLLIDNLKRYDDALSVLDKILGIKPDYPGIWTYRSMCLRNLSRYAEAVEADDKILSLNPEYANSWNNKGYDLEHLSRYSEALGAYTKALELVPSHVIAGNNRNILLRKLKEYSESKPAEALVAFEAVLEYEPENPSIWWRKARALDVLTRYNDALAACDKAISINPEFTSACETRSLILLHLHRYDEVLSMCERLINNVYTNATVWQTKGIALLNLRRYDESLVALSNAIDIDPNLAWAYSYKGEVLNQLALYDVALNLLDDAILKASIDQTDLHFHARYQKARALSASGNRSNAIHNLEIAYSLLKPHKCDWERAANDVFLKDLLHDKAIKPYRPQEMGFLKKLQRLFSAK